jgi:hypothetical protein
MPSTDQLWRLEVSGSREFDMSLRVLDLVFQLGVLPERVLIERCQDGQSIVGMVRISDRRAAILIEKIRTMVLVRTALLVRVDAGTRAATLEVTQLARS